MNIKALVAEFIGTFALVFIGVGAIATDYLINGESGLLGVAFAHGLTITTMVAATIAVSGAHFNPAVTVAMFLTKNIDAQHALAYIITQCFAGIVAAILIKCCYPVDVLQAVKMGTPFLADGVSVKTGMIVEIVLTFFLVFVIFGVAVDKRAPQGAPLFIGFAVMMAILMGGPVSGAAMNPARYLGPAILGGGVQHMWLYWLGPLIGGVGAGFLYTNVIMEKS